MKGKSLLYISLGVFALIYFLIYRARRRIDLHTVSLEAAMQHMKTGDLILFSGRHIPTDSSPGEITRRALVLGATYVYRAVDACEWGHVGVVYKPTSGPNVGTTYLVHCEMTGSEPDIFSGERVTGVQVVDLKTKLAQYHGYCVWRPISKAIDEITMLSYLRQTYHMSYSIPGDVWMRLLDRIFYGRGRVKSLVEYRGSMFCTEWAGAFLEYARVFDAQHGPYGGYYLPSDFTARRCEWLLKSDYTFPGQGFELLT